MSRLHRFTASPCRELPAQVLVNAIADWLVSPERMRLHKDTDRAATFPGRCLLCGDQLPVAFYVSSGAEIREVAPASKHYQNVHSRWAGAQLSPEFEGTDGKKWAVHAVQFCNAAAAGPTRANPDAPDLYELARTEIRRREREAEAREKAAARQHEQPSVRTKTSV